MKNKGWTLFIFSINWAFFLCRGHCPSSEFSCEDGTCISEEFICDGLRECLDGSDETITLCGRRPCSIQDDTKDAIFGLFDIELSQPFRCQYGACISGQGTCNGRADCADGSDETHELCSSKRCSNDEFKCDSGGCIVASRRCNGRADCSDGSDETEWLCSKMSKSCRPRYFRCNYGACIYHLKKCDGKGDCVDHSDESAVTCGQEHASNYKTEPPRHTVPIRDVPSTSTAPPTTTPTSLPSTTVPTSTIPSTTTSSTTTTSPTTFILSTTSSTTILPGITHATNYFSEPPPPSHSSVTERTPPPSNSTDDSDLVSFEVCSELHCLCPSPLNVCVPCSPDADVDEVCAALVSEYNVCSTEVVENVQVEILSCEASSPPHFMNIDADFHRMNLPPENPENALTDSQRCNGYGTVAFVNCWGKSSQVVSCEADGKWYPKGLTHDLQAMPSLCQAPKINSEVCGMLPSIRRGSKKGFPWPFLVGVRKKQVYKCTGTLIASQWVLTAARCVENFEEERVNGTEAHLSIQHALTNQNIYTKISSVHIHPEYIARVTKRKPGITFNDIALLKLERPLILTENLVPACLHRRESNDSRIAATFLRINGRRRHKWNLMVQTLDTECVDTEEGCLEQHQVGNDHYCGKSETNSSSVLSKMSSGGPYLVNTGTDNRERWAVAGVYLGMWRKGRCSRRMVFASVSHHWDWIMDCVHRGQCYW